MRRQINNSIWSVALSYVGAFVGAGFISGQELAQFFLQFGIFGWVAWLLVLLTISFGGAKVMSYLTSRDYSSFEDMVKDLYGRRMTLPVNLVFNGYLIGGLVIMMSGASNLLSSISGLTLLWSTLLISGMIFLIIIGGGSRLIKTNKVLVPILILCSMFVTCFLVKEYGSGFLVNKKIVVANASPLLKNFLFSYLFYIGYNAIGAIVALLNISREISDKTIGYAGGLIGGIIIAILGTLLMVVMWASYPVWVGAELPLVEILKSSYQNIYLIFAPAIMVAMFNVAVAYALGVSKYIEHKWKMNLNKSAFILVTIMAPISLMGFSKLLGIIYPFFGILATILVIYLVISFFYKKYVQYI